MSAGRAPGGHIDALDGLRAIAIILVLLRHTFAPIAEQWPTHFRIGGYQLLTGFNNGWIGVDLFFVLSGYLITATFPADVRAPSAIRKYLLKRVLRIVPAYYVALLFSAALVYAAGAMPIGSLAHSLSYHLLFLQDYFPANINVAFWSLGVEEKFYLSALLLVPALRALLKRFGWGGVALVLALLVGLGAALRIAVYIAYGMPDTYAVFFFVARSPFHACLAPLLLGVLIALLHRHGAAVPGESQRAGARRLFLISFAALVVLLGSVPMMAHITWYDVGPQPLLIALVMAGLVAGAVSGGGFGWLSSPVLKHVAVLSYSLYLVHLPLRPLCERILAALPGIDASPYLYAAVMLPLYLAASYLVAVALHRAVERPFLRIKDRL